MNFFYWFVWEWNVSFLCSHRDRWMVWSFVLGLQCLLGIIGWWPTTFWPGSQWHESFFAQSAEWRSCQRERGEKTAVHARIHTAASDQGGCFLWGCWSHSAGTAKNSFVSPTFLVTMSSKNKLDLDFTVHIFMVWLVCYNSLQEFCLLNFGQHLWTAKSVSHVFHQ